MALQAQLWSINGLSVELGIDRRTLAKRLQGLPPVEVSGQYKKYLMRDVIARLYKKDWSLHVDNNDEAPRYQALINFVVTLFASLAQPAALSIKLETRGAVKPDLIWRIVDLHFILLLEILGEQIDDPDFLFEPPEIFDRLNKPKCRTELIAWLENQPNTPEEFMKNDALNATSLRIGLE